jgi:cytidylate kinase
MKPMKIHEAHSELDLPVQIAIDGPGASGKTTIAEMLADYLNYLYFDTGVMYRAVTLEALNRYGNVLDEKLVSDLARQIQIDVCPPTRNDGRKNDVLVDHTDVTWAIRSQAVTDAVSAVSAYPEVRDAMTDRQRRIAERGKVVMVGRDIGTVVIPHADLKIFLDASVEERARRRYKEDKARGLEVKYEDILYSLEQRDQKDQSRLIAPLKPAEDAVIIHTDHLSVQEVFEKVKSLL